MIIGHGVDLVEHDTFVRLVPQVEAFLQRSLTADEIAVGISNVDPVQLFASRFAVVPILVDYPCSSHSSKRNGNPQPTVMDSLLDERNVSE
jgi:hypothetical protein